MEPFTSLDAPAVPFATAQHRHRPDLAGALPAEAARDRTSAATCSTTSASGRTAARTRTSSSTRPPFRDAQGHRRRTELRLRLLARERGLGALRLRLPRGDRAELRRHLLQQQPQERAAADHPVRRRWSRSCCSTWRRTPGARVRIDLPKQTVSPAGRQRRITSRSTSSPNTACSTASTNWTTPCRASMRSPPSSAATAATDG